MPTRGQEATAVVHDAVFAAFPHLVPGLEARPNPRLGVDPDALTSEDLEKALTPERLPGFARALQQAGSCARPIRLHGRSQLIDTRTGEILSDYASDQEPLGVTYVRCGNRRESVCPSCSRLYAGDTFHLIRAGIVGGKTVPARVADNPLVFATLTAPSFGKVHGRSDHTGLCQLQRRPSTGEAMAACPHGRPWTCARRHAEDDPLLGQPLCPECYDYDSHVVWQWWAPALWRRFTIALRRSVAKHLHVPAADLPAVATVQYAKVAEFQARGAIHFHALIRLDGPVTPDGFAPAPGGVEASVLARLVGGAAAGVRLPVPGVDADDPERLLAFGRQIDARPISARRRPDDPTRVLVPEQVAGYLAKYATKSATDDDSGEDEHRRRLRRTCRQLAIRAASACPDGERSSAPYELLGKWISMFGFRGHFATKSRRYSVTLGALRRARRRAQVLIAQHQRTGEPLDLAAIEAVLLADEEDETTLVIGSWTYTGSGWANETERVLALAAAARAREYDRERAHDRKQAHNSGDEKWKMWNS